MSTREHSMTHAMAGGFYFSVWRYYYSADPPTVR